MNREPVFVIAEGDAYLVVCTPNRGVLRGDPIRVGKSAVKEVLYFDASAPTGAGETPKA